ncbi:hypothetical protein XU18_0135 [Perkinsela sp. CCAP 1560/4]|nr:hypothetical protein XU18_0135 [Perkinsela sp. CCAP 1560/4]|eukprot:KNH09450.1 hypothetical protein XU18_0135 [Perkinsela sp. CCAP 1560/4]
MTIQLTRFLMKLSNETVRLEMKDGSSITGTIVGVDTMMNTHLKGVKVTQKDGSSLELEQLTVRGNTIRYYQLPDSINLDAYLKNLTPNHRQGRKNVDPRKRQRTNTNQKN